MWKDYTERVEKATTEIRKILNCYNTNTSPVKNVNYWIELNKASKKYDLKYEVLNNILQGEKNNELKK